MNSGSSGQSGQNGGGSNSGTGSESGGQNSSQETTTTQQQATQTNANSIATTSATRSPTSTSTSSSSSSSSSSSHKDAMIGGVVGGIAGLLLISLLIIYFLNRRQKKRIIEKRGSADPVTYATLNNSLAGVPFNHSNHSSQHDNLFPPPTLLTPSTGLSTPHGVGIRGGYDVEHDSGDYFLPTYAESQAGMSLGGMRALGQLNTSNIGSGSETTVSPMSIRHPGGTPTTVSGISPQTTGGSLPFMMPQHTRDTMGFPVDATDIGIQRTSTPSLPIVSPVIVSPVPRHPLVHQNSLERVAREGTVSPEFQDVNLLSPSNGPVGRAFSQELMRESPVLGQMSPVMMQGAGPSNLNGVQRIESQRTVNSESSMGVSIVSDTELDRLGVGSKRNFT